MSTERMAGNQEYAWSWGAESPEWAQIHAIRALAYEQRTANLIALATTDPSFYGSAGPYEWAEIATRLGREDHTEQP